VHKSAPPASPALRTASFPAGAPSLRFLQGWGISLLLFERFSRPAPSPPTIFFLHTLVSPARRRRATNRCPSASPVTIPPLFHSPLLKITSTFYSSVVISGMIRHAILPRPLPAKSRNTCLPSSVVNCLQNTELFHLTSFLSAFSALFSPTDARQPFCNQFVPHSFHRHGGVGGMTLRKTRASLPPAINYRLSTVDFPALHRPALSAAEGSLPLITPLKATLTARLVTICKQTSYKPFGITSLRTSSHLNHLDSHRYKKQGVGGTFPQVSIRSGWKSRASAGRFVRPGRSCGATRDLSSPCAKSCLPHSIPLLCAYRLRLPSSARRVERHVWEAVQSLFRMTA